MIKYIYDGTFEGFLTAVFDSYSRKEVPFSIVAESKDNNDLFSDNFVIITDLEKAERVKKGILKTLGKYNFSLIIRCFLSGKEGIEKVLLAYIRLGFKYGENVYQMKGIDIVLDVLTVNKKVCNEREKFYGILRFKELKSGLLFAEIEPEANILPLLSHHFKTRFKNENWAILDSKRHQLLLYDKKELFFYTKLNGLDYDNLKSKAFYSENELLFQNLWKNYFKNIAIKERKNPKLQRQFMPKKYWKHLIEKQ